MCNHLKNNVYETIIYKFIHPSYVGEQFWFDISFAK